ncbi:MAG TPA: hypothetical protein VI790_02620 [Candidatus Nanoarchaeia archaeon]|nr:hypothetical protein [Candidatus Nanoarchaeia archaeon]
MVAKKRWFTIISPKIFGSKELGETMSDDPKKVKGRVLTTNAKELTNDFKRSHISIKLLVKEVVDDNALTEISGYAVSRPYLQRLVHKGMSSIAIVEDVTTSDNQKIRVKCTAVVNGKIQTTKKKLIRERFISESSRMFSEMTLDNIVFIASTNKIQKMLVTKLKKVHPLRFVEIKKIDVLDSSKKIEVKPKEEKVVEEETMAKTEQ